MVCKALGKGVAHATELAFAGLASQVGFLMAPQLTGQGVALALLLAGESALPHMLAHVVAQGSGVGQVTPTYGTPWDQLGQSQWPSGSSCAYGESQHAKALLPLLAGQRVLARVWDLVLLPVPCGAANFVTLDALEWPHSLAGQCVGLEAPL